MIALVAVFFIFIIFFGFIGASRGWAKEVLVVASVVLAIAVIVLLNYFLKLDQLITDKTILYWIYMAILVVMVIFGYQSPKVARIAKATEKRAVIGEKLLGFFFGMISGYFVVGTAWWLSANAGYPLLDKFIIPPTADIAELTERVLNILPPTWLDSPVTVFIVVVVIFIFVMIYFI
jgi:uncharacterized membrane protein required for colicin V production